MLRKPNSIPAGDTVIVDPVMEPFFIAKSQSGGCYTVYERVIKGVNNTEYIKTICYPSTFNHALKAVARERLHNGETKIYDIKGYINRWENIQKEMLSMTTIDS